MKSIKGLYNRRAKGQPITFEWIKSNTIAEGECWSWIGHRMGAPPLAYGMVNDREKGRRLVHRIAYEMARGPIPEGLAIDHLCRNTSCCNPDHLEAVTHEVNIRRGNALKHVNGVCYRCGSSNLVRADRKAKRCGHRCRPCHNASRRAWNKRKKLITATPERG